MQIQTSEISVNPKRVVDSNVHINDVFFSDADDDAVIEAVERELRLKREKIVSESSAELGNELDKVQEYSDEVFNQQLDQPSPLIDLKPKRSLLDFAKNDFDKTKILPITPNNKPKVEPNDIFESPRSDEAPDLQIGEGEFDQEAYERAYLAVSL